MIEVMSWFLALFLIGWIAFPITYLLLPFLSDRGLTVARPVGLLFWGYGYWLLCSLGIINNDIGGSLLVLGCVLLVSVISIKNIGWRTLNDWCSNHRRLIITQEILFFCLFLGWSYIRALNPEIVGTEKPMELAFINALLRSPQFPPQDPWLSGYSISYYYFGYVMVALLARVTSISGSVAFNLAVASWFAMTASAAYGLLFNLLQQRQDTPRRITDHIAALMAPFFVLVVSNLEGFLEIIHAGGAFWSKNAEGNLDSGFWSWVNILELNQAPSLPLSIIPERIGGIWWWRASRVLQDFDLSGQSKEIIDEFPFFSYLLGDLHPHVLAMPFVLVSLGVILNYFLRGMNHHEAEDLLSTLKKKEFWFVALVLGSLAFINTWDFPIYLVIFSLVNGLMFFHATNDWRKSILWMVRQGFIYGIAGIILFLPFYFSFSSQAGGFLPSLSFFTRTIYFLVMFFPLLFPIVIWLIRQTKSPAGNYSFSKGIKYTLPIILLLGLGSYLIGFLVVNGESIISAISGQGNTFTQKNKLSEVVNLFFALHGTTSPETLIGGSLVRRLTDPGTVLILGGLLCLCFGFFATKGNTSPDNEIEKKRNSLPNSDIYVLILVIAAAGLTLFPEFFYLRDQFGWRMNTIFKFYFQSWILWSICAAYASIVLWRTKKGIPGIAFKICWVIVIITAMIYPVFGLVSKTNNFSSDSLTLDGIQFYERSSALEMQAMNWLKDAPYGVVAEAIGGSYSQFARVSTYTGLPTVLGWPGHESQWRGGGIEMGSRESDINRLFRTHDWQEAAEIIKQYKIKYVYVGSLERSTYRAYEDKFLNGLSIAFKNDAVTIYRER